MVVAMDSQLISASESVDPKAFEYGEKLGAGTFGTVYRVTHKSTGETYAMKVLLRKKIENANLLRYCLTERNVMSGVRHPYVMSLSYAFQTQHQFVLVMKFCPGGNLQALIKRKGKLSLELSRHYAAQVLLACEHLHQQKVLYRDLKPENVVLDEVGHAMVTDFGLSKENWEEGTRAKSFLGSVCYLAPEILLRKGHNRTVDIYGLGVLTHNMVTGKVPFFNKNKEAMWEAIKVAKLVIPEELPQDVASFIQDTMRRTPAKRLGAATTSDCRLHHFFAPTDFDALLRREVPLPTENSEVSKTVESTAVAEKDKAKDDMHAQTKDPVHRYDVFGRTNYCLRAFKCLVSTPVQDWDYTSGFSKR